jgi:preprotein translocase subunit SecF
MIQNVKFACSLSMIFAWFIPSIVMIKYRMMKHDWNKNAGLLLKTEMKRKNMTSEKLAKRLKKIGVDTTADSIRQKISRGTLKTALLLQCLYVMKTDSIDIGHLFPKETINDE